MLPTSQPECWTHLILSLILVLKTLGTSDLKSLEHPTLKVTLLHPSELCKLNCFLGFVFLPDKDSFAKFIQQECGTDLHACGWWEKKTKPTQSENNSLIPTHGAPSSASVDKLRSDSQQEGRETSRPAVHSALKGLSVHLGLTQCVYVFVRARVCAGGQIS